MVSSLSSADMEEHSGPVPGHSARVLGEGVLLQRRHAGVLLWQRPGDVPAHSELLPHREAPLPPTRVHPGFRRGAGLLRHRARDHRRLLHGGTPELLPSSNSLSGSAVELKATRDEKILTNTSTRSSVTNTEPSPTTFMYKQQEVLIEETEKSSSKL